VNHLVAGWTAIALMVIIGVWYGFRLKKKKEQNQGK